MPVTLYDAEGNEYNRIGPATNGKMLSASLPAAGFDGAELSATTSIGIVAMIAVGYALISTKKKKENKFGV